eukprot:m.202042 g.202042  ORF g.202042 m.202042 type:complete len:470 (-) comp32813_c1_seq1:31-1440(-)
MRADRMMDEGCIIHPPHVQLENLGNAAVEILPTTTLTSATILSHQSTKNNIDPTRTFQFGNFKHELTALSHQRKIIPSPHLTSVPQQTSSSRPNLKLNGNSDLKALPLSDNLLPDRVVGAKKNKGRRSASDSISISSASYSLVSDSISLSSVAYSLVSSSDEEEDDDDDDKKTQLEDDLCDCKVSSLPISPLLQSPFPSPKSTANPPKATTSTTTVTSTAPATTNPTTDEPIDRTHPTLPLITITSPPVITTDPSISTLTSTSIRSPNFKSMSTTPSNTSLNSLATTAQPGLSALRRELSGPSRRVSAPRPFMSDVTCLDVPIPHVDCNACPSCNDVCGHADCKSCEKKSLAISKAKQSTTSTSWLGGKTTPKDKFTWCQVRRCNHSKACWYVVRNKVYDATDYLASGVHPGHTKTLLKKAGQDATNDFKFHSKQARNSLAKMHIGSLVACDSQRGEAKPKKSWALSQW